MYIFAYKSLPVGKAKGMQVIEKWLQKIGNNTG